MQGEERNEEGKTYSGLCLSTCYWSLWVVLVDGSRGAVGTNKYLAMPRWLLMGVVGINKYKGV